MNQKNLKYFKQKNIKIIKYDLPRPSNSNELRKGILERKILKIIKRYKYCLNS